MIFRLTGAVETADVREGTAKGSGKPYSIPFAVVRVNDFIATEVNLADALVGKISKGDMVDLIVDVEKTQSGYISARATGNWPTAAPLHAARTATA